MPTSRITSTGDIGGISLNSTTSATADGQIGHEVTVAAGEAAELFVRTDDTSGQLAYAETPIVEAGDVIGLFWTGGGRYDVDVDSVVGSLVNFSGGAGDVLPAADSDIVACEQQTIDTDFDGDLLRMIGALCASQGRLVFYESGSVVGLVVELGEAQLWTWSDVSGFTNPLASTNVVDASVAQAGTSSTATFKLGILYDSTG